MADTDTLIAQAIAHEDVQQVVADACLVDTLPPASLLSGDVTISRPATADDYVAAVQANIDQFPGLAAADVTPAAVAAVLPSNAADQIGA